MFSFLYWTAPNVKQPGFKFASPGGIVALVIWIVASLLFALYVATFASYNKTYGSLGGVIVFLLWIWITNLAILFGAEFNSELQRSQQREAGEPRAAGRAVPRAPRHQQAREEGRATRPHRKERHGKGQARPEALLPHAQGRHPQERRAPAVRAT